MSINRRYPALELLPCIRQALENGAKVSAEPIEIRERFNEYFDIEIEGWIHGITNYPGEIYKELVHTIIRELRPAFEQAIIHFYPFDIVDISLKLSKAAKYLIHEKEIAFCILAQFPHPTQLDENSLFIMGQVIDQVENEWGGAVERLNRKWQLNKQSNQQQAA
ncbi:MAG: hypothetical protein KDD56_06300 [Bdellovibrionales bacterium]|nr:hypothetical protein [Bdellovibrionales bacterium]